MGQTLKKREEKIKKRADRAINGEVYFPDRIVDDLSKVDGEIKKNKKRKIISR